MPSLRLSHPLDLSSTLLGGQTFCWSENRGGDFSGWIKGQPLNLRIQGQCLHWDNPDLPPSSIAQYFCLDLDLPKALAKGGKDPWLTMALQTHPGLRPVRDDPWECLVNFICSSLKQIVQIRQINARLRAAFGGKEKTFPSAQTLAQAGEKNLRACALGYRARHVFQTSEILSLSPAFLDLPTGLSTWVAAQHLEQLPGVGAKISRCVLLYAYSRWDAFPVDVWVARLIRELYFPRRRKPFGLEEIEQWSGHQFGESRGLAQLLLFHWYRTRPDSRPSRITKR
ncbi:hypothetical protein EBX31_00455 [bacterium]|nr:hypothetical protein [bacterium]